MMNLFRIKLKTNTLRVRFTIAAVVISFVSFGLAAFFSIQWLTKEIEEDYKEKAALMGTHIVHDLETAMLTRNHGGIPEVLNLYRGYNGVEEIRVFNVKGEETFSQGKGPSEPRIEEAFHKGQPIHFHKEIDKREVSSFVFLMKNNPSCHQCHEKNEAFRGAILLSLSQDHLESYIIASRKKFYAVFAFLALAICAVTIITVDRLFLKPLGAIQKGAEEIGKGNYQYQVAVKSKDEIGDLAGTFNHMAQALLVQRQDLSEQYNLVSKARTTWQETFDCITDGIAVMDRHCHFLKVNLAFRDMFREYFHLPDDPTDRKCSDLLGRCLFPECPHQVSRRERGPVNAEIRIPKSEKILEISIFPFNNAQGEAIRSVAILKDITVKKENELKWIMKERLAAVGQMASGVAHEINNPLATISISSEGLLKRLKKGRLNPQIFESYLDLIQEEAHRIRNITSGMLSFVRKGAKEKREVSIPELLDKTLEMVGLQGRLKEVEVLRDYHQDLPLLMADEGELRQIFLSLISNALDAMEEKGRLTLEAGTEDRAAFIKIGDTGSGIPFDIINKIFDPFFTTKEKKGGTGLGLFIVAKIIRENNGRIEVASEAGRGATFKITLPLGVSLTPRATPAAKI